MWQPLKGDRGGDDAGDGVGGPAVVMVVVVIAL